MALEDSSNSQKVQRTNPLRKLTLQIFWEIISPFRVELIRKIALLITKRFCSVNKILKLPYNCQNITKYKIQIQEFHFSYVVASGICKTILDWTKMIKIKRRYFPRMDCKIKKIERRWRRF